MSWTLLLGLVSGLATAVALLAHRRRDLARMARGREELVRAKERGTHRARLQYPHVDLSRCIGCGTCVQACPEEGVLDVINGQALVVHGSRCVGHGRCAEECPVGAIAVTLGDVSDRDDIPAVTESFEVPDVPGLFLAGEVTGYALVRTAITHGTAVADEVARRVEAGVDGARTVEDALDLLIVGAGPAGLACSLEAKAHGLRHLTIEQEELGGTVAKYPRRKLVMTQPVELPLHGRLKRTSYEKEELLEIWKEVIRQHELPVWTGVRFQGLARRADALLEVTTSGGPVVARNVCLALGRRGTPRKLGVPGEELPKVAYGLVDAMGYRGRRILVVGGGDSAVEAALGLAEQPGNEVVVSYRRAAFTRIKARNEARLSEALRRRRLAVVFSSTVVRITAEAVELSVAGADGEERMVLPNDDVFVLAGGTPPFGMLAECGVSFDPARVQSAAPPTDEGPGLLPALRVALGLATGALVWALLFRSYYGLPASARTTSGLHRLLRPSAGAGLGFGIAAAGLVVVNLAYLARRSARVALNLGSLRTWMTAHVVTGILALVLACLHAAFDPRQTVGGHALLLMVLLVATGAVGRYFYALVPRAANGRELQLDEVRSRIAGLSSEWDRYNRDFGERVRREVQALTSGERWRGSLPRRIWALLRSQSHLRSTLARLRALGRREGVPRRELDAVLLLARRAQRNALMAAHFEDLRGLLATWRYVHRWSGLLLVLLVLLHVVTALRFGGLLD